MVRNKLNIVVCCIILALLSSCGTKIPFHSSLVAHDIVCVGDSITYGFKLSDPAHNSYPAQLSQKSNGVWNVTNMGVNGATVLSKGDIPYVAQKQYVELKKTAPSVVVIMLGTNDLKNNNWTHIDEFISDYVKMINGFHHLSSKPKVFVCSIPPILVDYPNGINAERQGLINSLIKEAATITGAKYIDVNAKFLANNKYSIDGVHPSKAGASLIADLVFKSIVTI
ncbi:GDSL-type esterase/lipase family protein [Desulforhopalus sp. 52FAK]